VPLFPEAGQIEKDYSKAHSDDRASDHEEGTVEPGIYDVLGSWLENQGPQYRDEETKTAHEPDRLRPGFVNEDGA
jgi:hypothetical protein